MDINSIPLTSTARVEMLAQLTDMDPQARRQVCRHVCLTVLQGQDVREALADLLVKSDAVCDHITETVVNILSGPPSSMTT